jgi:hypothetical protein
MYREAITKHHKALPSITKRYQASQSTTHHKAQPITKHNPSQSNCKEAPAALANFRSSLRDLSIAVKLLANRS